MTKYHVNWFTGNPQACTRSDCDEEFHTLDYAQASREYETSMERFLLPPAWTKKNRPRN